MLEELHMHHYICSILHVPDITMCPRKCIIALCSILHVPEEMHHCMFSILHVPEEMHHRIVPEVCISSRLHRARSLHAPESNQVTRVSTDVKNRYALFTHYLYSKGVVLQRRHLSWLADFMSWPKDLFYVYHVPKA